MLVLQQQQLFDEIASLPLELKTQIVDNILQSINPVDKSIDDIWIDQVQKRKKEIESGDVALVDGDEVFKKISQRFQ
jgi:hypothetical protein